MRTELLKGNFVGECLHWRSSEQESSLGEMDFEELKKDRPAKEEKVELKTLPEHLKYVYLGENKTKPVIISQSIKKEEEAQLVEILKKHGFSYHINLLFHLI